MGVHHTGGHGVRRRWAIQSLILTYVRENSRMAANGFGHSRRSWDSLLGDCAGTDEASPIFRCVIYHAVYLSIRLHFPVLTESSFGAIGEESQYLAGV